MAGTKAVKLSNCDDVAIVDSEDYEMVASFGKWYKNDQGYAIKKTRVNGKSVSIRMHALINKTPKGLVTDHINGDRLDNRKENLRSVGQLINAWNREYKADHTKYDLPKGITYDKNREKFVATKTIRKRFESLEEAQDFVNQSERSIYARSF